jgi:hypothetical protein
VTTGRQRDGMVYFKIAFIDERGPHHERRDAC